MEVVERNVSRRHACPQCGNTLTRLVQIDEQNWVASCVNCGLTSEPVASKRQAKIVWRCIATGEDYDGTMARKRQK